jgi:hypothetical protein
VLALAAEFVLALWLAGFDRALTRFDSYQYLGAGCVRQSNGPSAPVPLMLAL